MMKQSNRIAAVPTGRTSRMMHMSGLALGVAGNMLAAGMRQAVGGQRPVWRDLLLTPENASRLAEKLSQLRGAAMKVGQLLSMEAGELLPPEFTHVLARLREDAHFMPLGQLADLLEAQWGIGWEARFARFSFTPMAAASIGQVHEAVLKSGQRLAIKVRYPGVARSIDSDVDNVAALFKALPLLPAGASLEALLVEAKRQLHEEADYCLEATHIGRFARLLADRPGLVLPEVIDDLSNDVVLAMTYVPGEPVETLADAEASLRNDLATRLVDLMLREFLDFGVVQTDPNFANYRYDRSSDRIGLLDFGATRIYAPERQAQVYGLIAAACTGDRTAVEAAAQKAGYLEEQDGAARRHAVIDLFMLVGEPARHGGPYDFGRSDLSARLRESSYVVGFNEGHWRMPPADLIFLHRKLAGLFLLCTRLRAQVDVAGLMQPWLATARPANRGT